PAGLPPGRGVQAGGAQAAGRGAAPGRLVGMARIVRYQGAIVQDHQLLLIQHREHASGRGYWVIPGGGQEGAESEEACVRREMLEETGLEVAVERLLFE